MKSTFSTIFYLKRQVVRKDGTVPVMGRITVDGTQTQFSCKISVDPKLWDTKGGRVMGRSTAALETNRLLDKMRVRINGHYQEIMERDNFVTAEKVKNELTPAFISDFEMFLRTDKHCCTNTVWIYVCPLRTMVFIAINNEWLTRDPFREYEIKKEETTRTFLTKEEIRLFASNI